MADALKGIQWVFFIACLIGLCGFLAIYTTKVFVHRDVVVAELKHPVRFNFFVFLMCRIAHGSVLQVRSRVGLRVRNRG